MVENGDEDFEELAAQLGDLTGDLTFGERLRYSRYKAAVHREEMADHLGVRWTAVLSWEEGNSQPRHFDEVVERWAKVTGCGSAWLRGE